MQPATGATEAYWPADQTGTLVDWPVGELLRQIAGEVPDRIALKGPRDPVTGTSWQWSYAEWLAKAEATGHLLQRYFATGEHVAVWAPNLPEWLLLQFGAAFAGIAVVAINPGSRSAELEHALGLSRAAGIFLTRGYRDADMGATLAEIRPRLPCLREVFFIEDWDQFDWPHDGAGPFPAVKPEQVAMLQFTSGTTGKAKAAMLSHGGLVNIAQFSSARFELPDGSIWLNWLPLFHTGGCVFGVMSCLWNRGTMILLNGFEPAAVLRAVAEERIAWLPLVPTTALALLDYPDRAQFDLSSLRVSTQGGAPVPPGLVERVEAELGFDHMMVYGQTETSSTVCLSLRHDTFYHKTQTIGKPMPHTEIRIVNANTGKIVSRGEAGEIQIRNFAVMLGYYGQPEETARTIDAEGWLHTGDLGSMDPDGYLRLTGRLKDLIIRGGENIYPREIEDMLDTHPGVAEAAVFGIPDDRWGEAIVVAIRQRPGHDIDFNSIKSFLLPLIARHKIPQHVWVTDTMPRTLSGKTQKFALREAYLHSVSKNILA